MRPLVEFGPPAMAMVRWHGQRDHPIAAEFDLGVHPGLQASACVRELESDFDSPRLVFDKRIDVCVARPSKASLG